MKKIILALFVSLLFSCSKDDANATTAPKICETDKTSSITLYNNTTVKWWYTIPDKTGAIIGSLEAGGSRQVTLNAGVYTEVFWEYWFTYNGIDYKWKYASESHLGFYQCSTADVGLTSDCNTTNIGYLVYANATNVPVTITIDGGSYEPIEPGKVKGYKVASGVAHNVVGKSSLGSYSLSPSVGNCQRIGTVLQ